MMTLLLIFMAFVALGGGIYLFAIEHERNALINAKISNQEVLRIAREHNGRVSVGLLAQKTTLDFIEAERKLYIMLSEGIFHHEYDENYQPIFVLNPHPTPTPTRTVAHETPPREMKGLPAPIILSDGEVIRYAVESKGKLTPSLLCMKAKIQFDDAKTVLERLQRKGVFDVEVLDGGVLVYVLPDWEMFL
jgi:hypothetical protein